ncbi:DNA invertase [Xenorhabdus hominickii]|uniref:DNA invertase n=1 Tax=Xenorhabdus hominickii TaxID=351679 RepID=A0A2G0Q836_XENHO|nr:DNA invertase [Xenorhabdus hominickii]PHM57257.1 DNA invertase [Xenorhabdus hominickii]
MYRIVAVCHQKEIAIQSPENSLNTEGKMAIQSIVVVAEAERERILERTNNGCPKSPADSLWLKAVLHFLCVHCNDQQDNHCYPG